jgi:hypothetical protein
MELSGSCNDYIVEHLLDDNNWWSYILGHWLGIIFILVLIMISIIKPKKEEYLLGEIKY